MTLGRTDCLTKRAPFLRASLQANSWLPCGNELLSGSGWCCRRHTAPIAAAHPVWHQKRRPLWPESAGASRAGADSTVWQRRRGRAGKSHPLRHSNTRHNSRRLCHALQKFGGGAGTAGGDCEKAARGRDVWRRRSRWVSPRSPGGRAGRRRCLSGAVQHQQADCALPLLPLWCASPSLAVSSRLTQRSCRRCSGLPFPVPRVAAAARLALLRSGHLGRHHGPVGAGQARAGERLGGVDGAHLSRRRLKKLRGAAEPSCVAGGATRPMMSTRRFDSTLSCAGWLSPPASTRRAHRTPPRPWPARWRGPELGRRSCSAYSPCASPPRAQAPSQQRTLPCCTADRAAAPAPPSDGFCW